MNRLGHFGTRRQLFRAIAGGAASFPFLALAKKCASAQVAPKPLPPPPPGEGARCPRPCPDARRVY